MNWYATIHRMEELASIYTTQNHSLASSTQVLEETLLLIDRQRKNIPFEGIYYGNEFCERLLPRAGELETVLEETRKKDLSMVLLVPYLTDSGLERLSPLLDILSGSDCCEVVMNDWGVIRYTRRNFPRIVPVLGRLMSRMMKEVRIKGFLKPGKAPPGALSVLRDCGYSNSDYNELLADNGIGRVELDIPPQGLGVEPAYGVKMSVHIPFAYVCTGRSCMPGSLNLRPQQKFTPFTACRTECMRWTLRLRQRHRPPSAEEQILIQKGNTVYYLEELSLIEDVLTGYEGNGIDRVVVDTNLLS